MKHLTLLVLLVLGLGIGSCGTSDPIVPSLVGTLEVYVYFRDQGLEGKSLELLEVGIERTTDASGLAVFSVPPGTYTLRAYDINRGGPCCPYVDEDVSIQTGKRTRVEIWDCVDCD